ncbi:hypothetical protein [Moheibacter lacus]|uniref:Uncharacterized protein n=1 Tax=Moheibacter lacus TaxID=2745851 RepID=A0A838ZRU5_9FLAO|nr:hypothetical protein [Moheibacter lacus]MBA5628549.1 hypothetical protein [Moheibacter lacus]
MNTIKLVKDYGEIYDHLLYKIRSSSENWLYDTIIELIIRKKIVHGNLTIPEDAEWQFKKNYNTFRYFENDERDINNVIAGGPVIKAVGHLQENEIVKKLIELRQDCSFLYFIIENFYGEEPSLSLMETNTMLLIKLIYEGIKNQKIKEFPEDYGFYIFTTNKISMDVTQLKETLKNKVCTEINSNFQDSPIKNTFVNPEELIWFNNNIDAIIEKLNIKQFEWIELIGSITDLRTHFDLLNCYYLFKRFEK